MLIHRASGDSYTNENSSKREKESWYDKIEKRDNIYNIIFSDSCDYIYK